MNIHELHPNNPVLLLDNIDPNWPAEEIAEAHMLADHLAEALRSVGHPVQIVHLQDTRLEETLAPFSPEEYVVFNWCEEVPGIPRSSSMAARTLEKLGFTFTGADARALLLSQDKPAVKTRLKEQGIPTPRWQVYQTSKVSDWNCFPAIVKPAHEHCSFGITHEAVVHSPQELSRQVEKVLETFCQPVLVEDFIDGREFHVSVIGNGRLNVFPIAEMDFSAIPEARGRLCTYDSKFTPSSEDYQMIQLRLPAPLSDDEEAEIKRVAVAAYQAAYCRDYARLDIRQRDGRFYVLDVNPNADLSPDTSLALSAEQAGYSYGQFGSLLVTLAASRHPVFARHGERSLCAPL